MPGLELQVSLGQNAGDEPPLAVAAPAGGAGLSLTDDAAVAADAKGCPC